MTISLDRSLPINLDHPAARNALLSFDFREPWQMAGAGYINDSIVGARGALEGTYTEALNWITENDEHWFKSTSATGPRILLQNYRPLISYPFTIVARIGHNSSGTSNPLIAFYNSGDTTRIIAIDFSTTIRFVVRNAGGTPNATDYLALAGLTLSGSDKRFTVIASIWGSNDQWCKMWIKEDGGSANSYTSATDFTVTFPTGIDSFALGGLSTSLSINGLVSTTRVFNYGMTDEFATEIMRDPVRWLRAPFHEPEINLIGAVPLAQTRGQARVGSVLVR